MKSMKIRNLFNHHLDGSFQSGLEAHHSAESALLIMFSDLLLIVDSYFKGDLDPLKNTFGNKPGGWFLTISLHLRKKMLMSELVFTH